MEEYKDFISFIEESIKKNWDLDALTDYEGSTLQYKDVARKIEKLHILFENAGVKKGDKIALCGRNSANWSVAFMATLAYGAVVVPILHEFKAEQVHNIVNHSEAKILFAGDVVWPTLNANEMPHLEGIIHIPDYSLLVSRTEQLTEAREHLNEFFGRKYPKFFRKEHVAYPNHPEANDLAMINYTSGTTSNSKGVMVPYRAIKIFAPVIVIAAFFFMGSEGFAQSVLGENATGLLGDIKKILTGSAQGAAGSAEFTDAVIAAL